MSFEDIDQARKQIDQLKTELGTLDHLYFAFPQVSSTTSENYSDPSGLVLSAIAVARDPSTAVAKDPIKKRVNASHPLPAVYVRLSGVVAVEFVVPTNTAKKMLKHRRCLVIEKWGDTFVCRVPNFIRDELDRETVSVVGIPPTGYSWNLQVVRKLQEVCRELSTQRKASTTRNG